MATYKGKSGGEPKVQRDENGLLVGAKYHFKENGMIDWRKMVNPEHLVFNLQQAQQITNQYQKKLEDLKVTEVDDKYLLILLAGMKELASLRGYTSVTYNIATASREFSAVSCRINWIPNIETDGKEIIFESLADAAIDTTTGFGRNYILACAENRAFVRCVRNSLGVYVVGYDEIGEKSYQPAQKTLDVTDPRFSLKVTLENKKISFDKFKSEWIKAGHEEAQKWTKLEDVPSNQVYYILGKMKQL